MADKYEVRTTEGVLAKTGKTDKSGKALGALTKEQAESSARMMNERAEGLGIKTRYEVVEVGK